MLGRVLGHDRIERKLGEGGRGVVYRARDQRLQHDVAIKVLATGTLADQAAREAHICAMVGEPDLAIDQLEYLMSIPADFGAGALKLDLAWDPLRDHPRFQRLLERASR